MSHEMDDIERVVETISVGGKTVTLSMYPEEVDSAVEIGEMFNKARGENGLAFFLPALPSDEGYVDGDWLFRSYILFAAPTLDLRSPAQRTHVPIPIFRHDGELGTSCLRRVNSLVGDKLKVLPAEVFASFTHWYPDELGTRKRNYQEHLASLFSLNPQILSNVRPVYAYKTYLFLNRVGMKIERFLDFLPNFGDESIDHFLMRKVREGQYPELKRFCIPGEPHQYRMVGL